MSKETLALEVMKADGAITPHTAIYLHQNYRLAVSINRLRGKGWRIHTQIVRGHNKYGDYRYAKYTLLSRHRNREA